MILAALAIAAIGSAVAGKPPNDFTQCLEIADADARLACYDRFARTRRAGHPSPVAPPDAAPASAEARFGNAQAERKGRIEAIHANIAATGVNGFGKLVVTLDNGQVWLQTDGKRYRAAVGDAVTVRRSSYGPGFRLKTEGGRRFIQVKRIR